MGAIITNTICEVWNLKFKNNRLILNCSIKEADGKCFNILEVLKPNILFDNRKRIIDNYTEYAEIYITYNCIYLYKSKMYFYSWELPNEADNKDIIKFCINDRYECKKLYRELIKVIRMVEALASHYNMYNKNLLSKGLFTMVRKDERKLILSCSIINNIHYSPIHNRNFTFYHMKVFRDTLSKWKDTYNSNKIKYYIIYKRNKYDEYVRIKPFRRMKDISKLIDVTEDITTKYKEKNILLCIFPIDKL